MLIQFRLRLLLAHWRQLPRYHECRNLGSMAASEDIRVATPIFNSIFTKEVKELSQLFEKYSFELRIAGGAVRDILMNKTPNDIDFATTATPTQMKEMFTAENVRMIHHKGETHGTVTARILDSVNFEVTTLRIDKVTDGRHAEVAFTTDWKVDALRRDLTINAMFLSLDGKLFDFFNGVEDLNARRVRFVGQAEDRIREDYLRILRYFRFYGRIAEKTDCHEEAILTAIKENAKGLGQISGERIWMELQKIITGRFAPHLMTMIARCGLTPFCGLPSQLAVERFDKVFSRVGEDELRPASSLGCLLMTEEEAIQAFNRLRFSKMDLDMMMLVTKEWEVLLSLGEDLSGYQRLFLLSPGLYKNYKLCLMEAMKLMGVSEGTRLQFESWTPPRFPLRGNVLSREWGIRGREVGRCMEALRLRWVESGMTATEADLMSSRVRDELLTPSSSGDIPDT